MIKSSISVLFDSNIWETLCDYNAKNLDTDFAVIYNSIKKGLIKPFISAASLIEQIPRKDRKQVLSCYGNVSSSLRNIDGVIHVDISPNGIAYPALPRQFIKKLNIAKNLGFKFIGTYRCGMPHIINPLINKEDYICQNDVENFHLVNQRLEEAYNFIRNDLRAGDNQMIEMVNNICQREENKVLSHSNWLEVFGYCTDDEVKKISKVISELCDGDLVVACYAYQLSYLCTNDKAGNAGKNSVFYKENKQKLKEKLAVSILTSLELFQKLLSC